MIHNLGWGGEGWGYLGIVIKSSRISNSNIYAQTEFSVIPFYLSPSSPNLMSFLNAFFLFL